MVRNDGRVLKLAVISDLHAAIPNEKGEVGSFASTASAAGRPNDDAIVSLLELIRRDGLSANYMICCGDMADRAVPTAMEYIWGRVHELAGKLQCSSAIATVGNHDIDSRFAHNKFDARGILRGLRPPYPLSEPARNHEFWSRNFTILEHPPLIRFVVLNSCAYHGYSPEKGGQEYHHGRVSEQTLDELKNELEQSTYTPPINVLVTHHHPHKHQDIDATDYSSMDGGERLLDLLGAIGSGRWVVIHGHKHHPRICFGAGGANSPLVLGAGSLSAKLYAEISARTRNQFHIIQFYLDEAQQIGLDLAGEVHSWDYVYGLGWSPAQGASGLPAIAGFGARPQISATTQRLLGLFNADKPIVRWAEVLQEFPELRYTLPMDIDMLRRELSRRGVESVPNVGAIIELVKKP